MIFTNNFVNLFNTKTFVTLKKAIYIQYAEVSGNSLQSDSSFGKEMSHSFLFKRIKTLNFA